MKATQARSAALAALIVFTVASDHASAATVSGELKCWHNVTLSLEGPQADETDTSPNPFTDYGFWVDFRHVESGDRFWVPGYFAADGNAGESGATSGNVWRAHLAPHKPGVWEYTVNFTQAEGAALDKSCPGEAVEGADNQTGEFTVAPTDKTGRDFRGKGRLQYVGERYLKFAQTGETFLKAGPDSPETLLGTKDFDGTITRKVKLKTWEAHLRDWREGDPTWRDGRGKGLIGALNYLADKGLNSVSFIPYNAGGDGDNAWPMIAPDKKLHYDCSKLDQWGIVFDHAQRQGLYLHFKLQEAENDDWRKQWDPNVKLTPIPAALDEGKLGVERKLYFKELVARFGHELALNWNLGEENSQPFEVQAEMARYLRSIDPYNHLVVLHTLPPQQEMRYRPHVGRKDTLTGVSIQDHWINSHRQTKKWIAESKKSGHQWVVAHDEQAPADGGVPPDASYASRNKEQPKYTQADIRKHTLWGNLIAGGAGVEYYFGYKLAEHDMDCEDWRSRDAAWDDCRHALEFFEKNPMPLVEMHSADELAKASGKHGPYCLAKPGSVYLVYALQGGEPKLDLSDADGTYQVNWYDPRNGGELQSGSVVSVEGGDRRSLGEAPNTPGEDWLILIRSKEAP